MKIFASSLNLIAIGLLIYINLTEQNNVKSLLHYVIFGFTLLVILDVHKQAFYFIALIVNFLFMALGVWGAYLGLMTYGYFPISLIFIFLTAPLFNIIYLGINLIKNPQYNLGVPKEAK